MDFFFFFRFFLSCRCVVGSLSFVLLVNLSIHTAWVTMISSFHSVENKPNDINKPFSVVVILAFGYICMVQSHSSTCVLISFSYGFSFVIGKCFDKYFVPYDIVNIVAIGCKRELLYRWITTTHNSANDIEIVSANRSWFGCQIKQWTFHTHTNTRTVTLKVIIFLQWFWHSFKFQILWLFDSFDHVNDTTNYPFS